MTRIFGEDMADRTAGDRSYGPAVHPRGSGDPERQIESAEASGPLGSRLRGNERRIRHASINWKRIEATFAACSSIFPVHPHARGRDVGPDPLGGLRADAIEPARNRRYRRVSKRHEVGTRLIQAAA